MRYGDSIVINKEKLSIKLNGTIPTRDILSSLDEIVDAAIAAPSNYVKPASKRKTLSKIIFLDLITTKDVIR